MVAEVEELLVVALAAVEMTRAKEATVILYKCIQQHASSSSTTTKEITKIITAGCSIDPRQDLIERPSLCRSLDMYILGNGACMGPILHLLATMLGMYGPVS
jgi:hypothetical protein